MHEIYQARVAEGRLTPDPAQEEVLPEFERIRRELSEAPRGRGGLRGLFGRAPEPVKGLYLWGGVGRGKSMLMDMFFEAVDVPKRRVHFHAFMQEVHEGMHEARKRGVDDAVKPVAERVAGEVRLLCFDEMQVSDIADAMIVGRLFDMLLAGGVTVVTTSNRPPGDLYKDGLSREHFLPFIEIMKTRLEVVELASPRDHRQGRLSGQQVYFVPADRAAREAVDAIWQDLTGGAAEPLRLRVKNRDVVLPAYRDGVARAEFWELCGKALGPADYLAIADAVRVLILENVPRLSRSNFNEAKRFVTLVDALYEAKARLVMSAAAEPESLYVEGTGAFEFERTASRLREMQDAAWGDGGERAG